MEAVGVISTKLDTEPEMPRPRLIALLFADWATQTADNKAVLGGIFDRVTVGADAPRVARFYIYLRLAETFSDAVTVVLYAPDGEPTGELRADGRELNLTPGEPNYLQIVSPFTFEFSVAGTWWFDVRYKGESLGRVPLLVTFAGEQNGNTDEKQA